MPFLVRPEQSPVFTQRTHGIVNPTPGDIAQALKCFLVDSFETQLQNRFGADNFIVDRYSLGNDIEVPAIQVAPVPDNYTLQNKGLSFTVLPQAAMPDPKEDKVYSIKTIWSILIRDHSDGGSSFMHQIVSLIMQKLFTAAEFIPDYDIEETDAHAPSGVLYVTLIDNPLATRNLETKTNLI